MANRRPAANPAPDGLPVREQLERILASPAFQQSDRLKRFLRFIVLQAMEGHGDQLKEYVIGVQVFGKEESFDPRTDPIVRVQARRLRAKLVHHYREEGRADELIIDLPKGGYAPVFRRRETPVLLRRSIGAAVVSRNTVAILRFADHSVGRDLEYICRGVREEIVHHLARLSSLRLLASDEPQVVEDAEPALIISGSARRSGDRLRLTATLVDGAHRCYLWSESVDAGIDDVLAAQERVATAIYNKLEPELRDKRLGSRIRGSSENLAAHNLYLQGRYHLNQRTDEGLRKALDFFEKALVEDAESALAHAGLADAYGLLAHYGVFGPAEAWTKAASSAATAVMLDAESAEAHTSLAHVKSTQDWDWANAEREFQRAISLNPSYATAHH